MARLGFIGRIGRAIRNIVAPSPPTRRPEPPPEGPREREPRDPFRQTWRDQRAKGDYKKNLKAFHKVVDPIESDRGEQVELWDSYVRNIVRGEGRYRRNSTSNMFWRDSGIDPADFDWALWREAMGYTGKRRSRS